jgi:hypothetical protein
MMIWVSCILYVYASLHAQSWSLASGLKQMA